MIDIDTLIFLSILYLVFIGVLAMYACYDLVKRIEKYKS